MAGGPGRGHRPFIFYRGLLLIKGTRAVSIMHGFLLIINIYYMSGEVGLNTLLGC